MAHIKVKIIELRGETGLLTPGTLHSLPKKQAEKWIKLGWVKAIPKPRKNKEHKAKIETKELK